MSPAPNGPWTAILIGHQWPEDSSLETLAANARSRHALGSAFDSYADSLRATSEMFLGAQDGTTAQHARAVFAAGESHARTIAARNTAKKTALEQAHSTTTELRAHLAGIAERGNDRIREILESGQPRQAKVAQITEAVSQARAEANIRAGACGQEALGAIQSVLEDSGVDMSAHRFAAAHGFDPARRYASTDFADLHQRIDDALSPESPSGGATLSSLAGIPAAPTDPVAPSASTAPPATAPPVTAPRALTPYGGEPRPTTAVAPQSPPSATPLAAAPGSSPVGNHAVVQRHHSVVQGRSGAGPRIGIAPHRVERARPSGTPSADAADDRLRVLLNFVALQEPALSWAIGTRYDGSTVLATDLAGGWIPPHIAIPAGVRLLTPRSRTGPLEALLGAITDVEFYRPGQSPPPMIGSPVPTSASARLTVPVEGLAGKLSEATRRRDGLPRLAHTLAGAACAGTRLVDSDADVLTGHLGLVVRRVMASYPGNVVAADVRDWQLLATIDALINDDRELAHYHFSWFSG